MRLGQSGGEKKDLRDEDGEVGEQPRKESHTKSVLKLRVYIVKSCKCVVFQASKKVCVWLSLGKMFSP